MADVVKLIDGSNCIVFGLKDLLELIDEHLGDDARSWLEEYLAESNDNGEYIEDLEAELKGAKDHHREVMEELRRQSETLAGLIRKKEIDRKKLSEAAGIIGSITWREMNV